MKSEDIFHGYPKLETERTLLRKIRHEDQSDMFHYCSDPEVSKYTTWYPHRTPEDTRMFIDFVSNAYSKKEPVAWGIEDKQQNKLIGTCGFVYWNTKHARAELGYALSREYWNQGYMSEVARKFIQFGFEQMKLIRIEARCHPENIGSARVMEKAGMKFEGVLRKYLFAKGKYEDVKLYAITEEDWKGNGS